MRQTSSAVALLLALDSAQADLRVIMLNQPTAAVGDSMNTNPFNPAQSELTAASNLLNSRTAPYKNVGPNAVFTEVDANAKWGTIQPRLEKVGTTDDSDMTLASGSSTCMACLGGGGVWCSRTYAYVSTTTYMAAATTKAAGDMSTVKSTSDPEQLGGAALDQGACCNTAAAFSTFIGTLSVPKATFTEPTTGESASGVLMGKGACPAMKGSAWASGPVITMAAASIDDAATMWTSWWCSNGLYKKVTQSATIFMNSQQIIPSGTNQRMELAQVGCPQLGTACGQTDTTIATALVSGAATKFAMPISGFSVDDKCTWMVYSALMAPTFTLENSELGSKLGLVSGNWQIHNMEYTAGTWTEGQQSLPTSAASAGYQQLAPALSLTSQLPLFWMPSTAFAALRTWYGAGATGSDAVTAMPANWSSAGQAAFDNTVASSLQLAPVTSQLYGNVANVPQAGHSGSGTTSDVIGATQNYGTYDGKQFDLRAMRYFPAMVAQTVHASGSALKLKYDTELGLYNTAKTTWDAYVAILEKNAGQDAFAALFSPPKAPTVPPLPNKPWAPATYNGYVRATADQVAAYSATGTTGTEVASPTAQQFWTSLAAAQTVGGWGSFTAQLFVFRNGWGKSFGTIGYSGDAAHLAMSDVWNYKWTCAATSAAGAAASTTSQCANTYSAVAGAAAGAGAQTLQNTVNMISVVSLWSTSNKIGAAGANVKSQWAINGFQITFTGSAWKSGIVGLTAIGAVTPAVDAKSLSGIAGAQALAATSAAALAVAAALY